MAITNEHAIETVRPYIIPEFLPGEIPPVAHLRSLTAQVPHPRYYNFDNEFGLFRRGAELQRAGLVRACWSLSRFRRNKTRQPPLMKSLTRSRAWRD